MEALVLPARTRTALGKQAKSVLHKHAIPAVLYGHGVTNRNLEIDGLVFGKIFRQAGSSSLVDLTIDDGQAIKVLIHDVQRHPTSDDFTHVDLYQVKMTEKIETDIALNFIGESPAVKEQGGILVRPMDEIRVSCLPGDLVHAIDVDISQLKTFEDHIRIQDLPIPSGLTVLDDVEAIVASVTPPRSEAEIEALDSAVAEDVSTVEKVEEKKDAESDEDAEAETGDKKPEAKKEAKKDE